MTPQIDYVYIRSGLDARHTRICLASVRLLSWILHLSGAVLLIMQALGVRGRCVGGRVANKWKGWIRLKTNPELVPR